MLKICLFPCHIVCAFVHISTSILLFFLELLVDLVIFTCRRLEQARFVEVVKQSHFCGRVHHALGKYLQHTEHHHSHHNLSRDSKFSTDTKNLFVRGVLGEVKKCCFCCWLCKFCSPRNVA
eukprot:Gregarina_sp_Poly_1__1080@NODE_1264_length_4570_cov_95_245614_g859_i0_p9_GENE_NODE_1264_length_4570_cov_95_245614_g859_i0NODE_1264_length_4570_cov_95_245614_g859_i0_p9_ORF_typecomplete_len121_score11_11OTT_1508_deam/PF14441_6/0_027AalphaY_MDB/PF04611_12/0_099_NODE_1264_length_4570_cov_95_245614_g859_i033883750